jgi:hypothetical protein
MLKVKVRENPLATSSCECSHKVIMGGAERTVSIVHRGVNSSQHHVFDQVTSITYITFLPQVRIPQKKKKKRKITEDSGREAGKKKESAEVGAEQ